MRGDRCRLRNLKHPILERITHLKIHWTYFVFQITIVDTYEAILNVTLRFIVSKISRWLLLDTKYIFGLKLPSYIFNDQH